MQRGIWKYLLYTLLVAFTVSCENEIDVAADWKEVAIVYGALNPSDEKNYIRINRAYLDERQSAFRFINDPDSLYFDSLIVTLDEIRNGRLNKTIEAKLVDGNDLGIPKDSGLFYFDTNPLYEISEKIEPSTFINDYEYRLTITNPKTGYVCTGRTMSNGKADVSNPVSENSPKKIFPRATEDHNIYVLFQEGKYVRAYTIEMITRVEEFKKDNPSDSRIREVKWNMVNLGKTRSLTNFLESEYLIPSASFFSNLAVQLGVDSSVNRRLVNYDINFYGVSDDFNTYVDVSKPSIGIIQKKPEFTNIENGLGLFASRHITRFQNREFDSTTTVEIQLSEFSSELNFVYP